MTKSSVERNLRKAFEEYKHLKELARQERECPKKSDKKQDCDESVHRRYKVDKCHDKESEKSGKKHKKHDSKGKPRREKCHEEERKCKDSLFVIYDNDEEKKGKDCKDKDRRIWVYENKKRHEEDHDITTSCDEMKDMKDMKGMKMCDMKGMKMGEMKEHRRKSHCSDDEKSARTRSDCESEHKSSKWCEDDFDESEDCHDSHDSKGTMSECECDSEHSTEKQSHHEEEHSARHSRDDHTEHHDDSHCDQEVHTDTDKEEKCKDEKRKDEKCKDDKPKEKEEKECEKVEEKCRDEKPKEKEEKECKKVEEKRRDEKPKEKDEKDCKKKTGESFLRCVGNSIIVNKEGIQMKIDEKNAFKITEGFIDCCKNIIKNVKNPCTDEDLANFGTVKNFSGLYSQLRVFEAKKPASDRNEFLHFKETYEIDNLSDCKEEHKEKKDCHEEKPYIVKLEQGLHYVRGYFIFESQTQNVNPVTMRIQKLEKGKHTGLLYCHELTLPQQIGQEFVHLVNIYLNVEEKEGIEFTISTKNGKNLKLKHDSILEVFKTHSSRVQSF